MNVGTDHDTATFAVASIRGWWRWEGRHLYPAADTLLITDRGNREASARPNAVVIPGRLGLKGVMPADLYTPIPYIIPAQLFAARLAEIKHLDPDRPRTLSKITRTL